MTSRLIGPRCGKDGRIEACARLTMAACAGTAPMSWRAYQEALGKGVACEMPGERH